jgi:hypothetical protein
MFLLGCCQVRRAIIQVSSSFIKRQQTCHRLLDRGLLTMKNESLPANPKNEFAFLHNAPGVCVRNACRSVLRPMPSAA